LSEAPDQTEPVNPFDRPHPLRRLFRDHPAIAISSAYVAASAIGIMFSFDFYRHFDVNFFNFAEISDFLMAVLREPITFLLALGGVLVLALFRGYTYLEWRFFSRRPLKSWWLRAYYHMSRPFYGNPWLEAIVLVLYVFLFIAQYGEWKAERILSGEHAELVWLETPQARREVVLLGATNRFVFAYDPVADNVSIVPHENLLRVIVDPQRESIPVEENAAGQR
jgi:hypothetical protein